MRSRLALITSIAVLAGFGLHAGGAGAGFRIEYDYLGFGSQALNFIVATPSSYSSNARLNVQETRRD